MAHQSARFWSLYASHGCAGQKAILAFERELALRYSEAVNQTPRLGQSLEAPLETVAIRDVTEFSDTRLSGHVYQLRNGRVVAIIRAVLAREAKPDAARDR